MIQGFKAVKFIFGLCPKLTLSILAFGLVSPVFGFIVGKATAEITNSIQIDPSRSVLVLLVIICICLIADKTWSTLDRAIKTRWNIHTNYRFGRMRDQKRLELDIGTIRSAEFKNLVQQIIESPFGWRAMNESVSINFQMMSRFVSFAIATYVICTFDWKLGMMLFLFVIPEFVSDIYFARKYWRIIELIAADGKSMDEFKSHFQGVIPVTETKLFKSQNMLLGKLDHVWAGRVSKICRFENQRAISSLATALLSIIGLIYAMHQIVLSAQNGQVQLGTMGFVISNIYNMRQSCSALLSTLASQFEIAKNVQRIFSFFELESLLVIAPRTSSKQVRKNEAPVIRFENVWFKYPNTEEFALKGVNFELKAGDRVGIFGENGAGKSSFLSLLCRIHDPTEGRITVDGIDLCEISPDDWQEHLSVLMQKNNTYSMKIGDSLRVACSERILTDEDLLNHARFADAMTVIQEKGGLDTQLGTEFDGIELSGGQEKRLAILRRMIRVANEKHVLILDEPEKELSSHACDVFFGQLRELPDKVLAVYVSHNIATLRLAKTVIVLEKGEIVAFGTHEELLKSDNEYSRAYKSQMDTLLGRLRQLEQDGK